MLFDIAEKWHAIGEGLNVRQDLLFGLKFSAMDDFHKLNEVIQSWKLYGLSPVSWEALIIVVEGPLVNDKRKANEIREHLRKCKHTYNER